jgi:hypothetical protein
MNDMNRKHLRSWVNLEFVIDRLRELSDHIEYINHINKCISMLVSLQSKLTNEKTSFTNSELNDVYALFRVWTPTQGYNSILSLLVDDKE